MKPKNIYLLLCVAGFVLPYWQFVPWLAQNGLNMKLFFTQLFANHIAAFFGMDVFMSAIVLVVFFTFEKSRLSSLRGRWLPVLALLTVGVSLALPLFLYLREIALESSSDSKKNAVA